MLGRMRRELCSIIAHIRFFYGETFGPIAGGRRWLSHGFR